MNFPETLPSVNSDCCHVDNSACGPVNAANPAVQTISNLRLSQTFRACFRAGADSELGYRFLAG